MKWTTKQLIANFRKDEENCRRFGYDGIGNGRRIRAWKLREKRANFTRVEVVIDVLKWFHNCELSIDGPRKVAFELV
jgi:hypothetical protein